jgi:L-seryl-tRNA(Ser) seleniumtransferase
MAQVLAQKLRGGEFPIIGRISDDALLLDPRSVLPEEDQVVLGVLRNLATDLKRV